MLALLDQPDIQVHLKLQKIFILIPVVMPRTALTLPTDTVHI